jgi:hypothetical protein
MMPNQPTEPKITEHDYLPPEERKRWLIIYNAILEEDIETLEEFASEQRLNQPLSLEEVKQQLLQLAPGIRLLYRLILRDYIEKLKEKLGRG